MPTLTLDPENAAQSIAQRIDTIRKCKAYIKETMARYDGLKALEAALAAAGVSEDVKQIVAEG